MAISRIYNADFTGVSAIMGVELVATGSGGPTPPPEGQWEARFPLGSEGWGGNGQWWDGYWDPENENWNDSYSAGYMELHVDDPDAVWNLGYRPTKMRITGTPNNTGGAVELYDNEQFEIIGSYPSVGESDTVIEIDLQWEGTYGPLGDIGVLYLYGYAIVTNIEFFATAPTEYTLTIGVATGSGSVLPVTGTKYYAITGLTISGIADSGWTFSEWTGDTANVDSTTDAITNLVIPLNEDTDINANFVESWRNLAGNSYASANFAAITTLGSNVYVSTYGYDYNDDGWKNNGARLLQWNGSALTEVAGTPGAIYTGNWQSMSSIYPYGSTIFGLFSCTSRGGILLYWNGSNAWVEDIGDPDSGDGWTVSMLNPYDVYLASVGGSGGTLLRRHSEGGSWVQLIAYNSGWWGDIRAVAQFNGFLYAIGRFNPGAGYYEGYLWYYNSETHAWSQVVDGNGFNKTLGSLIVYSGNLYAAGSDGKLYRYNGSNAWTAVANDLGSSNQITSLCVYNNKLYAGVGWGDHKGALWVWNDSNAWEEVLVPLYSPYSGNAYSIKNIVTNGTSLYALTDASSGLMVDRLLEWTA